MESPTRSEVEAVLRDLIAGMRTRRSASDWASPWLLDETLVDDPLVWDALQLLGAADLVSTDRPYLYDEVDFRTCLDLLRRPEISSSGQAWPLAGPPLTPSHAERGGRP
jgi:hypothetical protein